MATVGAALAAEAIGVFALAGVGTAWLRAHLARTASRHLTGESEN